MSEWMVANSWCMSSTIEAENCADALAVAGKKFGFVVESKAAAQPVPKSEAKALRSTAPEYSLMNPRWKYTHSLDTDVRATIAAQRLRLAAQSARLRKKMAAHNDAATDALQLVFAF